MSDPASSCDVPDRPNDEAGFTLPEIIAALLILALSLGGIFGVLSDSLRRTGQAEAMAEAGALAQSLLASVGSELPFRPGTTTGDFGNGYRWRLEIAPYGDGADARSWPVAAYTVSADVVGTDDKPQVRLSTLRLGAREPGR
jgi:prepilin-type N-terminal cleavage/methylation domain-containing protein